MSPNICEALNEGSLGVRNPTSSHVRRHLSITSSSAQPSIALHSQEEHHSSVGHGIGQAQDAAPHDGVAQVEHRHPEGRLPLELAEQRQEKM